MPEGDTVWRTAQRLDRALSRRALTVSDFRVPQWAELDLTGQVVEQTVSRGKHLLTRVGRLTVHTHLKMEGSWHVYRPGATWRSPSFQARLVLANVDWQAVGFRLAEVEVVERALEHTVVGHLGPDLLGEDWSVTEAVRRLRAEPARPLAEALLDQRNLAGIGNMYKAELCFLFGVHPRTPVGEVADLERLVSRGRQLLGANKDRAEQTTTGSTRRGETLWVYNRKGRPCRRCSTAIETATVPTYESAGWSSSRPGEPDQARSDFWCPRCQPEG